jgi:hypothetical protein
MHVVYICTSVLMNYDCTTHPILPFITITTKFLSKHRIKRILDTKMNGYHYFNFTEKLCYEPGDLDTRKSTGTSCQIEIHFMIKTTEYLL